MNDIRQAPPLQRDERAKHYLGIKVRWSGFITHLDRIDYGKHAPPEIKVVLSASVVNEVRDEEVEFRVPEEPGWSLVHLGTVLDVSGTIISVRTYSVSLKDVTVHSLR